MTVAELRYLIATDALYDGENGVKLTEIAMKMGVTKVSVYRAVERLERNEYLKRNDKNKVVMTEKGKQVLAEYMVIIDFIRNHLECHCGTPAEIAYQDALGAAAAFSDISRSSISQCCKQQVEKNKES